MTENRRDGYFRRILVGYDGSREAKKALAVALSLASDVDSKVQVLAVVQPSEPSMSGGRKGGIDDARKEYEIALRGIATTANSDGIQVETEVTVGSPAEQIIQRAEQSRADLIVLGRRGVSNFEKLIMGSVSERVLGHAPCPVLVTR